MSDAPAGYAFLAALLGRSLVGRVAQILNDEGIPVAVLKGIALHVVAYDDPAERPITDVDLLVAPGDHPAAVAALERRGLRAGPATPWATVLQTEADGLALDLHGALFPPGLFRFDAEGLFARARRDEAHFGAEVYLPCPYDLYAHAVGHFAKTRMDERNPRTAADLAHLGALGLDPERCAAHLVDLGLGRAARYTFAALGTDDFARSVEAALPRDLVGRGCARLALALARRSPQPSRRSAPAAHLVNESVGRGLLSAGAQLVDVARRRRPAAAPRRG